MFMRLAIGAVALSFVFAGQAQTSLTGGALQGAVFDPSGGRVPGALVLATDPDTQRERRTTADGNGRYRFSELPAGSYEVSAASPGFAAYHHAAIPILLGTSVELDIALAPSTQMTSVTVSAQPPPIDPAQTAVTSSVDAERIEELPVESRNYLNFVLLAPGVSNSAEGAGSGGAASGRTANAAPDSGFTFGGLRGRSNNVAIDGLDNNDEFTGASRTELSLETIQEFQVVNAGLSAETGGASGGSIDVITRNGANLRHGDAFVFIENGTLGARSPFETEPLPPSLHRYRIGFALGGPIIRNKTFYYAAFEQEHSRAMDDSLIAPSTESWIRSVLASGRLPGLSGLRVDSDRFPTARAETEASMKVNHQLSAANALMARYAYTNNREAGDAFNASGLTDASARGSSFTRDSDGAAALTTVFTPQTLSDLRFQYAGRRVVTRTNDTTTAGFDIAGLADFGRPYAGNGERTETHEQLAYTVTHSSGNHLFKAGATVSRVHLDANLSDGFGGFYIFPGLASFADAAPNQYRQAFGDPHTDFSTLATGAFV